MDHPDWPTFIAAIIANPDDDTIRLVAADFLEEHGDPDRSAFIRIQVELARLGAIGEGKSLEVDHLRAKERLILGPLSVSWKLWAAEECPELVKVNFRDRSRLDAEVIGAERLTWERGFIQGVTCPAEVWSRHGVAVRKRQPVRSVVLTGCDQVSRGQWYGVLPALRGLRVVTLQGADQAIGRWLQGWLVAGEVVIVV
jgi:uncharacterized protein (TIGR02996 family)